ncbi:hypothetical protein [Wolbachia endosymbiont (group A) of Agelastica alni]|uniref:hypothetical protein n=1 Tax=Wolbachia endosymbiont (group A) of Agelastica alni TaxID=3066130 RepID=UPI0031331B9A
MLGKVKEFLKTILFFHNEDKVKTPYVPMVEGLPSDDTTLKPDKKKPEEHLTLLSNKAKESGNSDKTKGLPSDLSTQDIPKSTPDKNKRKYVELESDEEWNKFFALQNNPSTNTTNQKPFSPKKGESQYHGKEIVGKIADQIKSEISEGMKNNTIGSIMIKEGKREENVVYPSVRVVLNVSKEGVDIAKLLSGNICKKYNVKTITFCHSNQEKKRGACCYINDKGERVYEIISGLYEMTLKWYVDGKECKINIDDKNGVRLLESNGVTEEQLRANKEVKVGKRREPKFLHEALAPQLPQTQLQQSSEEVKFLEQHSTNVEDLSGASQKHQAPAASK